jgi:hypothetical protein
VLEEILSQRPTAMDHQRLLAELENACQTILDLPTEDMDRSQFYSVVATLQSMILRASHVAPGLHLPVQNERGVDPCGCPRV